MQSLRHWSKKVLRWGVMISLIGLLALSIPNAAWAARTGGRMGGGSFNVPRRSYSTPQRSYSASPTSPARPFGGGWGWGFPFLIPFFGFGGGFGGIFTLLIGLALLNFVVNAFRSSGFGSGGATATEAPPQITVAQVQVGLLSGARSLQTELNTLAQTVDTDSASGRGRLLQETSLALLRNPEYWQYGQAEATVTAIEQAEAQFNQYSLSERSKFTAETLINLNGDRQEQSTTAQGDGGPENSEYLVVTVLVGTQDSLNLPKVTDTQTLRQAVQALGALGSDRLLALEVLWTPQADGDTLTADDLLAQYPNLQLL